MSIEETRAVWDAEAATFDDEPDHGLRDPATRQAWRELLLAHLPPAPARVADLGCGTGTLSVLLAEEGYSVSGIDLSPAMVARAEAKGAGHDVTFAVGDAGDPDLAAGSGSAHSTCRDSTTSKEPVGRSGSPASPTANVTSWPVPLASARATISDERSTPLTE